MTKPYVIIDSGIPRLNVFSFLAAIFLAVIAAIIVYTIFVESSLPAKNLAHRIGAIEKNLEIEALLALTNAQISNAIVFVSIFVALIPIILAISIFFARSELEKLEEKLYLEIKEARSEIEGGVESKVRDVAEKVTLSKLSGEILDQAEKTAGSWLNSSWTLREAVHLFAINDVDEEPGVDPTLSSIAKVLNFEILLERLRSPNKPAREFALFQLITEISPKLSHVTSGKVLQYVESLEKDRHFSDYDLQRQIRELLTALANRPII
jgi:hypothetical protein